MKTYSVAYCVVAFSLVSALHGFAYPKDLSNVPRVTNQPSTWTKVENILRRGSRIQLTESGSSYLKFILSTQFWARLIETNPGSVNIHTGEPLDLYADFAVRRARWIAIANIEDRVILFSQIGITSFARNAPNRNPFYVHDFHGQIQYLPGHYIGAGLHLWRGLSRDARIAHANYLTLDNEGYNIPNILTIDWVGRQIGVFVHGRIGRLGYSLATNVTENANGKQYTDVEIAQAAADRVAQLRHHSEFNLHGYGYWSFLGKDRPLTSGAWAMTYMGQKGPIMNLGVGFQFQPGDIGYWSAAEQTVKHQASVAVASDLFVELPLSTGAVLNTYISYHYYDFGPNYIQTQNTMGGYAAADPDKETMLPGPGHILYAWGTGHVVHSEVGYMLPSTRFTGNFPLQPFLGLTWRHMQALQEATLTYRVGANWYLSGQSLKVTGEYAYRPVIAPDTRRVGTHKGLFVLQLQVRI